MSIERKFTDFTAKTGALKSTDVMMVDDWNGSIFTTKKILGNQIVPYNVYIKKISQSGTSAPTVTGGYSQLTGTLTFARSSAGVYSITNSVAEFTANNVFIFLQSGVGAGLAFYQVEYVNTTLLNIYTFNYSGVASDSLLLNSSLEIKIIN